MPDQSTTNGNYESTLASSSGLPHGQSKETTAGGKTAGQSVASQGPQQDPRSQPNGGAQTPLDPSSRTPSPSVYQTNQSAPPLAPSSPAKVRPRVSQIRDILAHDRLRKQQKQQQQQQQQRNAGAGTSTSTSTSTVACASACASTVECVSATPLKPLSIQIRQTTTHRPPARPTQQPAQSEQSEQPGQPKQPKQKQQNQAPVSRGSRPSAPEDVDMAPPPSDEPPLGDKTTTAGFTLPLNWEIPITKHTLSELDVSKIIHNPKLRHDINYDPELHFRPNHDGEKGRRKQEKARQYWDALASALRHFLTVGNDEFLRAVGTENDWPLPALLKAIKEIINTLVPGRDRSEIDEGLNVELLMQQFSHGVADLERVAVWLSGILKMHCAPMRDDQVDEMQRQLCEGNRTNEVDLLVKGLSSLLSVLEAMKLDVANHQIRCLRPLLIEETVQFEQRFFANKIRTGRMSTELAQLWFASAKMHYATQDPRFIEAFGEAAPFFFGLVNLLLPFNQAPVVPNTFLFDEDRIMKLRADMFDAVHLELCMRVYEKRAAEFDFNTPCQSPVSSRPPSVAYSDDGSTFSAPAAALPASLASAGLASAENLGLTPTDAADARARGQELYKRLRDILQSAPCTAQPHQRWLNLWPYMAAEISQSLGNIGRAQEVENELTSNLDESSMLRMEVVRAVRHRLLIALSSRVQEYKNLPGVSLFVMAANGRIMPNNVRSSSVVNASNQAAVAAASVAAALMAQRQAVVDPRVDGFAEDMATRLAHIGVLHWRVWGVLVYDRRPGVVESL